MTDGLEAVFLNQVEDGNRPLMLDIGVERPIVSSSTTSESRSPRGHTLVPEIETNSNGAGMGLQAFRLGQAIAAGAS